MPSSNYTNIVLSDNPVGYWKFDDSIDNVTENLGSVDEYDGKYFNTESTFSFVDATGESQYFNGNDSFTQIGLFTVPMVVANPGPLYATDFASIECWVSLTGKLYNSLKKKVIVAHAFYNDATQNFSWKYMLYIDELNKLNFKVYNAQEVITLTSTFQLLESKVYHIVVTLSENEHKLYINGHLNHNNLDLTDSPVTYNEDWPLHVGDIKSVDGMGTGGTGTLYSDFNDEWENFNGTIDELAVYDVILSDTRVSLHYDAGFGGNFSEVIGDKANYEIQHRIKRYDVVRSYAESVYDYCGNFEKSPLFNEGGENKTYHEYVNEQIKPDFWYTLDSPAGTTSENNFAAGSSGIPPVQYFGTTINAVVDGATTHTPPNLARKFNANAGYGTITTDLGSTAADTDNPFSIAFWYKHDKKQSGLSPVMGFQLAAADGNYGFHIFIASDNRMVMHKYSNVTNYYFVIDSSTREDSVVQNWNHYIITISSNGKMIMYRNGSAVAEASSDGKGIIKPAANAVFSISKSTHNNDKTNMYVDELIMLNRQLDSYEASLLYRSSRDGTIQVSVTGGEDIEFNSTKDQRAVTDELINEIDITHNVVSYTIERDLDQQASVAIIQMSEAFLSTEIKGLLKANTYLTIEERLIDADEEYDSGWMDVGHFLVDGPVGTDIEADQGGKAMNIKASSPSKIFGFDLVPIDLDPDIIQVRKRVATLKAENQNSYRFGVRRPGSDDDGTEREKWYRNWADYPAVKLWVSEFTAFTDSVERRLLDAQSGEELRIKGSGGSIQVLFGEGVVVIDRDYFEDPVAENGLGNPSYQDGGVKVELRRFATDEDLVQTEVARLETLGGRTYVTFSDNIYEGNGKTVIMRSGKSKGRFFKIWEVPI